MFAVTVPRACVNAELNTCEKGGTTPTPIVPVGAEPTLPALEGVTAICLWLSDAVPGFLKSEFSAADPFSKLVATDVSALDTSVENAVPAAWTLSPKAAAGVANWVLACSNSAVSAAVWL